MGDLRTKTSHLYCKSLPNGPILLRVSQFEAFGSVLFGVPLSTKTLPEIEVDFTSYKLHHSQLRVRLLVCETIPHGRRKRSAREVRLFGAQWMMVVSND